MSDQSLSVSVVRSKPNINVTPLIDVLLVMLIIFMVAAPLFIAVSDPVAPITVPVPGLSRRHREPRSADRHAPGDVARGCGRGKGNASGESGGERGDQYCAA